MPPLVDSANREGTVSDRDSSEQPTRVEPPHQAEQPPEPEDEPPRVSSPTATTDSTGQTDESTDGKQPSGSHPSEKPVANDASAPKLAEGIELVGEYEDSGYKEAPYIARRSDGQVIQMPPLLFFLAEEIDGQRGYDELAERISQKLERGITAENTQFLVEEKLRPLGVLTAADGSSPELQKSDPLLGLKFRTAVIPSGFTRTLTTIFRPFFYPPVIVAVLAGLVAVDIWFFFIHGAAQSTRELIYNPALLLMVIGLVVVATALHEIGHATAARYGGAEPGVMGVGIYIVWPAFYTDVTDAYRLGRGGRLRTDFGGVYFNVLFILAITGAYALTGFEPLLILIIVQHMQILQQFLPFLALDGYYILSDLTGVPDMFARIKPTLKSVVPGKDGGESVEQLKPWVRIAIASWVFALIPVLLFVFGMLIFNLPRMLATAWDSFGVQADRVADAWGDSDVLTMAVGSMQVAFLLLPLIGLTVTFSRIGGRLGRGAWNWSDDSYFRRGLIAGSGAAAAGLAAFVLLPNGEYRPIQPGERGTVQGGVSQFEHVSTGRPGLTEERQEELGGAPVVREQEPTPSSPDEIDGPTTPTTTTAPTTTTTTPTTTTTATDPTTTTTTEPTTTTTTTTTEPTTTTTTTEPTTTTTTTTTTTPEVP